MLKNYFKFLSSRAFQLLMAFVGGSALTFFIYDYIQLKSEKILSKDTPKAVSHLKREPQDPFFKINGIQDQMIKRMEQTMGGASPFTSSIFDRDFFSSDDLSSLSDIDLKISKSEDDKYKYITIQSKDLNKEELKINVSQGMISISGQYKKTEDNENNGTMSSSSYSSSYSKMFNVPYGVDSDNVKIENENDKIILKFPKITT